jgi:hypothetical protein
MDSTVADGRVSSEIDLAGTPVYGSSPQLHANDEELARVRSRASPEAAALGGSDARAWREENRGWERCGEVRGWCSPFIGVGGAPGRGGRGLTPALMALMPLKTGGGGLRGELREGK